MGLLLESLTNKQWTRRNQYPYNENEISDALDNEIANHLEEIGAGTAIPIRRERPGEIDVPIALQTPPYRVNRDNIELLFSTSREGVLKLILGDEEKDIKFEESMDGSVEVPREDAVVKLEFHFNVESGVSMRRFTLQTRTNGEVSVIEDVIMNDGNEYVLSKIYGEDNDDSTNFTGKGVCLICYTEIANVVALPCRHCSMCSKCARRFASLSTTCPVCRQKVTELIELE